MIMLCKNVQHLISRILFDFRLNNIYKVFLSKIQGSDAVKDLTWWSTQYGPLMPQKWPEFEVCDLIILISYVHIYSYNLINVV